MELSAFPDIAGVTGQEEIPVLDISGNHGKMKSGDLAYYAALQAAQIVNGGGGIPFKASVGRWVSQSPNATTLTTVGGAGNRLELTPWLVPINMHMDAVGVLVTAGVIAAVGKVLLYNSDASGKPNNLLYESGNLDMSAVAFAQVGTPNITLVKGQLVWIGHRHSSNPTLNAHNPYTMPSLDYGTAPTASPGKVYRRTLAYATPAPAVFTPLDTEIANAAPTAIFVKVASEVLL